jgi:Thioesterase-like superfamily
VPAGLDIDEGGEHVTDSYYELIDAADPLGEKFTATDLVRSTWTAAIQHAAPVSALLVRALEGCARRDDTRLSRVVIDLLGPVPAEGDFWVRSQLDRGGKQIELVSAEMLALAPDGQPRPVARASGWRLQQQDTEAVAHAAAPLPPPLSEARSRDLAKGWDRNYVHSLDWRWLTKPLNDGPGGSWIKPTVDLVNGEKMTQLERLFAVADCANGIGSKLDITKWTFLNTDLAVHVFRVPEGDWIGIQAETNYGPDGIGTTIGTLFDEQGAIGAIQQSVLVRRRPGRQS